MPTDDEWAAELNSWNSQTSAGAFDSPLKLPVAGGRTSGSGSLFSVGSSGSYWSSAVDGPSSGLLYFYSSFAVMFSDGRAYGLSVRCLKD